MSDRDASAGDSAHFWGLGVSSCSLVLWGGGASLRGANITYGPSVQVKTWENPHDLTSVSLPRCDMSFWDMTAMRQLCQLRARSLVPSEDDARERLRHGSDRYV